MRYLPIILIAIFLVSLANEELVKRRPILQRVTFLEEQNVELQKQVEVLEKRLDKLQEEVPSPLNLLCNSQFLETNVDGFPLGWIVSGTGVVAKICDKYTHGFVGPFVDKKPANAADRLELANANMPYFYGSYNAGRRLGRYPWGCNTNFNILHLKISGNGDGNGLLATENRQALFSAPGSFKFHCYVKIIDGTLGISQDTHFTTLVVTKTMSEQASEGWYILDANVALAGNGTSLIGFGRPHGNHEILECFVAIPYLYAQKAVWVADR